MLIMKESQYGLQLETCQRKWINKVDGYLRFDVLPIICLRETTVTNNYITQLEHRQCNNIERSLE